MERYFTTVALLGLNDGNLPVHRGMRNKRYESVEKMLDLLDVAKRIGPRFPLDAMMLDKTDPEWDDDMTYLYVDNQSMYKYFIYGCGVTVFFLYNYNALFHNKNFAFVTKATLFAHWVMFNTMYIRYRK